MLIIVDHRIKEASLSALCREGFKPLLMAPANYLSDAVSSHTDMLIFLGFGRLFCHKRYYESNASLIDHICETAALTLTLSDEATGDRYPEDVLFNACIVGNRLICNERTISKLILASARELGYEIIHVSQGYTKCSICRVSENAIITADKSIAIACREALIDVLLISEGHISLPPYEYGFIGGASGIWQDKVYFCGSLSAHPDGEKIEEFCKKHGKIAVSLSNGELQDVGSCYFIEESLWK